MLFFKLAVLFFASGHLSIDFLGKFKIVASVLFHRVSFLSVLLFTLFPTMLSPKRKKVFFDGAPNMKILTTSQLQAKYKIKLDFHFNLTLVRWI